MRLYDRKAIISAETFQAQSGASRGLQFICGRNGFDCRFDVNKDLTGKQNRATMDVFNLTDEHRSALSERAARGPMRVRLEAGYTEGTARIFEGDVRILYHDRTRGDFITRLELGDGDKLVQTARVFRSWAPGTPVDTVIRDVATALGLGEGNVRSTIGRKLTGWGPTFTGGTAASGPAFRELTRICRSAGLEWSIQDGTLQFLVTGKALSGKAVSITSQTGLEGVPKIDHKGHLKVTSLMIPDVFPGRKIQLEDKSTWRVDKAHYQGETRGRSWFIHMQASPIK